MPKGDGRKVGTPPGFERLRSFIETEMAMSHVYQPVMIRTMLEGGGAATRRQIAAAFLAADLSQLEYYEQVVGNYPGPVLKRRGIVEQDGSVFRLAAGMRRMDEWQRAALIALCDGRVADYVSKRQATIWAHRASNADPLPGTLRWQVIRRAMGRCEACGVSSEVRALEVDHIVPRSRGGTNDLWNLQALCSLCNVQKLDRDETDFHAAHKQVRHSHEGCGVCDQLAASDDPLTGAVTVDGSLAVAPRRHGVGWRALWQSELNALRRSELSTFPDDGGTTRIAMVGVGDGDAGHLVLVCGA
ncbi:HNH endonuclease signature motif containing protein [uncultured Sphingomonas sp.]|uniref:HNH endonuclease n=1 Tax=uncultured Sphingomonas sp. TaxID=158754 RepID=UPI0025F1F0E4|nr:HNH endonuclease signature motif containing protein [uncultured Sphingomonas sp.]